ncbi:MAG: hypothetical protein GY754_08050 [bacterium]|nr:hypothetical protein [bacterium]
MKNFKIPIIIKIYLIILFLALALFLWLHFFYLNCSKCDIAGTWKNTGIKCDSKGEKCEKGTGLKIVYRNDCAGYDYFSHDTFDSFEYSYMDGRLWLWYTNIHPFDSTDYSRDLVMSGVTRESEITFINKNAFLDKLVKEKFRFRADELNPTRSGGIEKWERVTQ